MDKIIYKYFSLITAAVCAVVMLCTLYAAPGIGLSDNGDFPRVMMSNNIYKIHEDNINYVYYPDYRMDISGDNVFERIVSLCRVDGAENYSSLSFTFIIMSKLLNFAANSLSGGPADRYNLFWLGLICIIFQTAAIYLFMKIFSGWTMKIAAALISIFIFCDQGYIIYFNSFYGEAFQVFSLLTAVSCIILSAAKTVENNGGKPKISYTVIGLTACLFYTGAKLANLPAGIMLIAALIVPVFFWQKYKLVFSCLAVTVIALTVSVQIAATPKWMTDVTNYHSVFFGIVKNSPEPEKDLETLGIDAKYATLANTTSYYTPDFAYDIYTGEFEEDFYSRVSKTEIALFYLKHPVRLFQKLGVSVMNSDRIEPVYLGNAGAEFERHHLVSRFNLWGNVRRYFGVANPAAVLIFCCIIAGWTAKNLFDKKRRAYALIIAGLLGAMLIALAIPMIGNGEADLAKHMFAYIQIFDILLSLAVLYTVYQLKYAKRIFLIGTVSVLVLAVSFNMIPKFWPEQSPVGDRVVFGRYDNEPLEWKIISVEDGGIAALWCNDIVLERTFANSNGSEVYGHGSNSWEDSELRNWLNTVFLREFTTDERAGIVNSENTCYVSVNEREKGASGSHPYYWSHAAPLIHRDNGDAFSYQLADMVFILSAEELSNYVVKRGWNYSTSRDYWLRTPYYDESSMVRCVMSNGTILRKDADYENVGVRPALKVSLTDLEKLAKH